ncbi:MULTISPECIES: hypothetical protein [Cyanophyceae]|nr:MULTISPECIES: hypothetical protein [unclassified Trichocoleus]
MSRSKPLEILLAIASYFSSDAFFSGLRLYFPESFILMLLESRPS